MADVSMNFYVHAPIERVFDAVCDHERFFSGPPIKSCRLTRPGEGERNGLGAQREVRSGPLRFVEDVTHYERPARMDYLVVDCTLPLEHEGGRLDFIDRGEGTEILWVSRFGLRLPFGGEALADFVGMGLVRTVSSLMRRVKEDLEH